MAGVEPQRAARPGRRLSRPHKSLFTRIQRSDVAGLDLPGRLDVWQADDGPPPPHDQPERPDLGPSRGRGARPELRRSANSRTTRRCRPRPRGRWPATGRPGRPAAGRLPQGWGPQRPDPRRSCGGSPTVLRKRNPERAFRSSLTLLGAGVPRGCRMRDAGAVGCQRLDVASARPALAAMRWRSMAR